MNLHNSTRRGLLKAATSVAAYGAGVAALSTGAAIVTAGKAHGATTAVSPELSRLIADFLAADAKLDRFYDEVWNPRVKRENALIARVPHTTITIPAGEGHSFPCTLTTAHAHDVAYCRGIVGIPRAKQSQSPAWQAKYDAAVAILQAQVDRDAALARIHKRTGMDEANRLESELDQHFGALLDKVTDFPSRNLHDLAAKLAFQRERGRGEDIIVDMVAADIDRLTKREG